MRVIAGKYKSRQLKTVKSTLTRPTTDRNKENMFNIIGPYFDGGKVLDLFGGSGSLGIEALSRGCEFLYTFDKQYAAYQVIKENFETLKIDHARVYKLDYKKALEKMNQENITFDVVLLDPPYGKQMADYSLSYLVNNKMLNPKCIVVVEELKEVTLPILSHLVGIKNVEYGITTLHIYSYQQGE